MLSSQQSRIVAASQPTPWWSSFSEINLRTAYGAQPLSAADKRFCSCLALALPCSCLALLLPCLALALPCSCLACSCLALALLCGLCFLGVLCGQPGCVSTKR